MEKHIFAYGTLMFPSVAGPIAGLTDAGIDATLIGYARYTVNDRERAKVPAIVQEAGAQVSGKLFLDVDDTSIEALDNFEDVDSGQYERWNVEVSLPDGRRVAAVTYVAGEKVRMMLSDPWDPNVFAKTELEFYVNNVVPKYTNEDLA